MSLAPIPNGANSLLLALQCFERNKREAVTKECNLFPYNFSLQIYNFTLCRAFLYTTIEIPKSNVQGFQTH
jgi:hypothetical protein